MEAPSGKITGSILPAELLTNYHKLLNVSAVHIKNI